jgi:hypothetical protein
MAFYVGFMLSGPLVSGDIRQAPPAISNAFDIECSLPLTVARIIMEVRNRIMVKDAVSSPKGNG